MSSDSIDDISINTIVGSGSFIRGELHVSGFVRVDGDIDGSIETSGRVIIGEKARIRGDVRSRIITIGGVVQGDVIALEGVTILSSGMVIGAVLTKKLYVEESVVLHGPCFAINDQARFDSALLDYNNKKAVDGSLASAAKGSV